MGKSEFIASVNHGIFATDEYYPKSGKYDFRYKSVESGKSDKVIVEFGSYPQADSVVFKDKYGVTYPISSKDNVLSFTGVSKADTNFIYAYRGDQKIGKLFLNTYQQKTYKVVLISVNEATLPNTTDLENELNKVYNQCAVSFKIETRDLQVSGIENFTHGGTKVAGSVWNASQKTVLEAFGEKYEDNTAYLFFIPKAETGGVAGYMPRYYPYGFIYPGAANRTIAHELGHGIAGLEHPFPESQVSGSTQNLMDYRDGTELWHFQWDMLQDPARKIFKWWQNEEDAEAFDLGANIVCITDEEIQKIKATQRYFYIADGRVVDLKDYNPSGFYTKDDKTESARGAVAKIRIDGYDYGMYYNKDTKQVSFFGYNTDPDHAAKKVEVAKLIVNDPEKIKLAQRVFPSDNTCDCKNFDINNHPNLKKLLVQKIENQKQAWLYDEKENKIIVVFGTDDAQSLLKVKNGTALSLDEIEGAEIKNYTLKEFANSKYNWLANDVRSTMNEAGKYVAISMGITVALPLFAEMSATLVPAYIKEKAIDFSLAFSTDFICSYVVNIFSYYLTESVKGDAFPIVMAKVFKDNWKEMLIDASMAGGQALLPAMSNTKRQVINASIYGVQALELVKIYNTISGTATSDEDKTTFAKQAFNFAVGAGMSLLSEKISKKLSIKQFNKKPFVAVFRQTLKNMKMADDDIATFIYKTAKACDHPIFKNLSEADEIIIKGLLSNDDGAKLLDLAYRNNICNAQTIKLLSYCKSKFDVGIRNVDLRIDPKIVGHLDYIANNLDEEGCLLVNNILNISNPEKVLPDLAETLRLFEKEGIKKEWIRQYYNYIKQETIVFHYKGQAYKYNMPKTIGEVKNTFTDIKVSSKMEFIEFHAVDKNGNPCWCFYLQSKNLYFVPIKDEVSKCYKWIEVGENVLSNFIRSDYVKKLIGIK